MAKTYIALNAVDVDRKGRALVVRGGRVETLRVDTLASWRKHSEKKIREGRDRKSWCVAGYGEKMRTQVKPPPPESLLKLPERGRAPPRRNQGTKARAPGVW